MKKKIVGTDFENNVECTSKGISAFTGDAVSENAVSAMKSYGIDISSHRAGKLTLYDIEAADLLVCMTKQQADILLAAGKRVVVLGEGIPDPYGFDMETYKECAAKISEAIDVLIEHLHSFKEKGTVISEMTQNDIPFIAEIEKDCFSAPWSENAIGEELENESARFYVLRNNGEVVGYMGMHIILDECYVANLAVKKSARKQGFGEMLLKHCSEKAKSEGCTFISLEVRVSNNPAISLYRKHGFSPIGERKNFYTDPAENALIMTKYFSEVD